MSSFSNSVGNSAANQAQVNAEQNSGSDLVFSVKMWSAQHIAMCAVFTALGIVLSYIEFPVFPAAAWLKYSPVGAVCILAGLAFGPITAALVSVLAWSTHLFTNLPGAIMAIVCCLALSVPAGLICRKNKSAKNIAIALIVYGIAFIWIEKRNANVEPEVTDLARMPYLTAFWIGCFQVLSIVPGTSRSGATILGAIIVGTSRSVAADFTFFLAIPTMFGYSGLKAVKFFLDGNVLNFSQFLILMVASVTAFLVSLYVIRFLTDYVKKHDFTVFGKYRIVLGTILILYSIVKFIF